MSVYYYVPGVSGPGVSPMAFQELEDIGEVLEFRTAGTVPHRPSNLRVKNCLSGQLVPQTGRQAMFGEPHDFIYLHASNFSLRVSELADFYKNGLSLKEISNRTDLSVSGVRYKLLEAGVPLRPAHRLSRRVALGTVGKRPVKPPYGFCYFDGRVVRHPKEYPILLQIIERWKLGEPLNSIAKWLEGRRVPSPMNRTWSWHSINKIIQRIKEGRLVQNGRDYELI